MRHGVLKYKRHDGKRKLSDMARRYRIAMETRPALAEKIITKSFEYKLKRPSKAFVEACENALEGSRFVYNCALEHRITRYRQGKPVSYFDQSRELTEARAELPLVKNTLRMIQQDALIRLDNAFNDFFSRVRSGVKAGFPRFKNSVRYRTFSLQVSKQDKCPLRGTSVVVPGVGISKIYLSRPIDGKVKQLRIVRRADGWYVQLICDISKPSQASELDNPVGIDLGLESFATLSNGEKFNISRSLHRNSKKLRRAHQRLNRKNVRSKNHTKTRRCLAKQYLAAQRKRRDSHHKIALSITNRFNPISVERLNINNMLKHPKLGRHIIDVAWGNFLRILSVKAENAGRVIHYVGCRNTSRICSRCRVVNDIMLNTRTYKCNNCGLTIDRDLNAAINVRQGMPNAKPVERLKLTPRRSRNGRKRV